MRLAPYFWMKDLTDICVGACSVAQSCLTLCDTMNFSPPVSSVHGIFQARILEWIAISTPGVLPDPWIKPTFLWSPALTGRYFTTSTTWEALNTVYCHLTFIFVLQYIENQCPSTPLKFLYHLQAAVSWALCQNILAYLSLRVIIFSFTLS